MKKAEFLAGKFDHNNKKLLEKVEKELNSEFIPDLYDKAMDGIFDEKYYQVEDKDGKHLEDQKDINLRLIND